MSYESTTIMEAIDLAMKTEKNINQFALDSIDKVENPKGKHLLRHLADLEQEHINKLYYLRQSVQSDSSLFEDSSDPGEDPRAVRNIEKDRQWLINLLHIADSSEAEAAEVYKKLAQEIDDRKWQENFNKLLDEEHTYQKVLQDEFYDLSNKEGFFHWGD